MTVFEEYYSFYMGTRAGFDKFHNEVINMPRDSFSNVGLSKIKLLAGYLLLTEGKLSSKGVSYKDVMNCIMKEIDNGNFPKDRDSKLEYEYFRGNDYSKVGRMFRHLMGWCSFFGLIISFSKQKKSINYDKCREYDYSKAEILTRVERNNFVTMNIKDVDYIKNLKGIHITEIADYRPSYAILKYMREIARPVTAFEISILLGRVDKLKIETEIINRALQIGRFFANSQKEQICYFFNCMNWKNTDGSFFQYASSQEPYFKFNTYILFLKNFDLIEYDSITETYTLTSYANKLLDDDISYYIADLENLLAIIDDYDANNSELNDIILHQRQPELTRFVTADPKFVEKMNFRSLNNPIINRNGKKQRNRLIMELAKILVEYKCQYTLEHTFKKFNGKYYCESHHIIEFSTEDGPDITENLVVLGPDAHARIHHGSEEVISEVYRQLIYNKALDIERFENMIKTYNCLTRNQINVLHSKRIITEQQKKSLLNLLSS